MRIEVREGGGVSDEELAAIVIALTPVAGGGAEGPGGPPAWGRAAILEGLGGQPVSSAPDLAGRRPGERS